MADPVHRIGREQLVLLPVWEAFAFLADAFNLEAITKRLEPGRRFVERQVKGPFRLLDP